MDELLFLSHRIPYPPDKGDKIRSYHLLRHLAARHRLHLGTYIDDPRDWQHVPVVEKMCSGQCCFVKIQPPRAKLRALSALLRGEPLTLPYYRRRQMADWVRNILNGHNIRYIVVYSSAPAQFVLEGVGPETRRIIDFVDVDSAKWQQYAQSRRGLMRWLYQREARTLLAYERRVAQSFDGSFFVSPAEADLFKGLAPESASRVDAWVNGVDADYFSPERSYPNPCPPGAAVMVFTGMMDYWANVDAVTWFADTVFPEVRRWVAEARFVIAGGKPTAAVRRLGERPGIEVTGRVPDMRPHLAHAKLAVVPMRIAQGIQNKVLEAMAMGLPVLATAKAMEGIDLPPGLERWVSDDPRGLAERAVTLLREPDGGAGEESGRAGREWVLEHHVWAANLKRLDRLLGG